MEDNSFLQTAVMMYYSSGLKMVRVGDASQGRQCFR